MLEADLHKQLRDFPLDLEIQVNGGEILALMGENGAGKSTTLNMLSGLLCPDTGSIRLNRNDLYNSAEGINVPVEYRNIGYILQNSAVFPHLTVTENIAYGMRARHQQKSRISEEIARWIGIMDIQGLAGVKAANLSGGQKQRVALARVFATRPELLMLDEPFTALDADSSIIVKNLIRSYIRENRIPCILVTHRISDVQDIGDAVCMIIRGNLGERRLSCELEHNL